ncbi:hypothetical protein Y032_1434g3874 [Ancylostoma ceylanicum]|uniref:Uncharacterized protein n=1 Tax=Ancylostoma ceylanicum TaxID=53326 RepID=A0A016W702_9BILA|nr:hypothetical protein Y032_1434g3874 [Ancylostoma ceylanicum]
MWLRCGSRVYLVAGPMLMDQATWYRVAELARKHVHGYLEERMELAGQVVDKLPTGPGVIDPSSPCFAVGQVPDIAKCLYEDRARLFYNVLRNQLSTYVNLEELPPSNYVRHRPVGRAGKPPTASMEKAQSGVPTALQSNINKNRLKRQEKRRIRSAARAAERAMQEMNLSSSGTHSASGGGM